MTTANPRSTLKGYLSVDAAPLQVEVGAEHGEFYLPHILAKASDDIDALSRIYYDFLM